jgi:N-acetylneuraminate synthase/N,N'-diacetyllegionaminate synthase
MSSDSVFVIAEAGVNHNGSLAIARRLVASAKEAGADAVKFQTFKAEALATRVAPKAAYQRNLTSASESQFDMLKRLELSESAHVELMGFCGEIGIQFMSSPFDEQSANLLENLGVTCFKLGSGELTNLPLLAHVARKAKPIILSTGMATLGEVEIALDVVRKNGDPDITLLHCVTQYPAPVAEINLRAMLTLRSAFGVPIGYSDHTEGSEVAIAAVALGAQAIEKHFTLDRSMEGPDHQASMEPGDFASMVQAIRRIHLALGDGIKRPAPCEIANIPIARKSLVAARSIAKGTVISRADIIIKRPGNGIAPGDLEKIVGLRAAADLQPDEVITWDALH